MYHHLISLLCHDTYHATTFLLLSQVQDLEAKHAQEMATLASHHKQRTAHTAWGIVRAYVKIRGLRRRLVMGKRTMRALRRNLLERDSTTEAQRRIAAEKELEWWKEIRRKQLLQEGLAKAQAREGKKRLLQKIKAIVDASEKQHSTTAR